MATKNKSLTVLSDAEQFALYGLPDFDEEQRLEFLSLSAAQLALACSRGGLHAQVYCVLQIGYFKAKHAFFRFTWDEVQADCAFVLARYFNDRAFEPQLVQIVRRDVTLGFIVAELVAYFNEHRIVRPGYTTLQTVISAALSAERRRLGEQLAEGLDAAAKEALAQLLVRDDTLSELAALKQDAKDFGWRQMARERDKRARLEPLYRIAKTLLPKLAVSQQNLLYYASLANFYTVYDLRRFKPEQTHLYLLC
jgi:hypothetical protein